MRSAKIINIKKIGIKRTKDIEVNNSSHTFYANGILTSNSHAVSYGIISYWTAYMKIHFPLHFYTSYLYYAKDKAETKDEVKILVNDAKSSEIEVTGPSMDRIFEGNPGKFNLSRKGIHFGIEDVNKIGRNNVIKFLNGVKIIEKKLHKPITEWTWLEFLIEFSNKTSTTVITNLILVGAFKNFKMSRAKLQFEYNIWKNITEREVKWFVGSYDDFDTLEDMLKEYLNVERKEGGPFSVKRQDVIRSLYSSLLMPPTELEKDNPAWVSKTEIELLSVPVTCSVLDSCNTALADTTCKEFNDGKNGKMSLAVELVSVREYIMNKGDNKGKSMGFFTVKDTHTMSAVCFSDSWTEYKSHFFEGNTLLLIGERSKNKDSFIIQRVLEI
jgi:DNA polymerase-3 subunit alpha